MRHDICQEDIWDCEVGYCRVRECANSKQNAEDGELVQLNDDGLCSECLRDSDDYYQTIRSLMPGRF